MSRLLGFMFGILWTGCVLANGSISWHKTLEQKFTGELKKYIPDALYIKPIADNQMAALVISNHELTRIFVAHDRILAVRGVDGTYLLNKDEIQGEIFIKPTPLNQGKAISLFITTEQGHNYTLLLAPADIPARAIELTPTGGSKLAERWEKNGNYQELISGLITAMINGKVPDGYALSVPKKLVSVKFKSIFVVLDTVYTGKYLRGEILVIENKSTTNITLAESQFYQVGTRAIAILEQNLQPKTTTLLYRVMSNE